MGFWLLAAIYVATTVVSALLAALKRPKGPQPSAIGDFQAPTAEEGRVIPVVWGTVILKAPNVTWWGDLRSVKLKAGGGILGFGITTVVGFKYYLGIWMALCHGPLDALVDIVIGDKSMAGTTTNTYKNQTKITATPGFPAPVGDATLGKLSQVLDWPNMFGGEQSEGGIQGTADFYYGTNDQEGNDYIGSKLSLSPAPAYRGLAHIVFRQGYIGISNYIKNWAFVVRRCPSNLGLTSDKTNLGGDANPAEMGYEILTNKKWGLGVPSARIDTASFIACAETLATENFGLSMQSDTATDADTLLTEIARHVDGVFQTDPSTGLWTMTLARADYDPDDLLELTASDIDERPALARGSWEETLNEIKIKFTDRSHNFEERLAQAQEIANFRTQGQLASATVGFLGISQPALANKIAMRELKTHSYPLLRGSLKTNRKAWNLRVGSVFKLSWRPGQPDGFAEMVVRVLQVNYGTLDDNHMEMEVCEDIFAVSHTSYDDPGNTGWTPPGITPADAEDVLAIEAPYGLSPTDESRIIVGAVRGDGITEGFHVQADESGGFTDYEDVPGSMPEGLLQADYPRDTDALDDSVGFTLDAGVDLLDLVGTDAAGVLRGDNLLYFEDTGEICSWREITDNGDGTFTFAGIIRGLFDTLPGDHGLGSAVLFFHTGFGFLKPAGAPVAGAQGPAGADGTPGTDGADGSPGAPGADGADGLSVLNGIADPGPSDGVNGDFWINTTSKFIFGPKASGAWPTGVSIVGPPGPTGTLDDLADVNVPSPGDGDLLTFDSATSKWINLTATFVSINGSPVGGIVGVRILINGA